MVGEGQRPEQLLLEQLEPAQLLRQLICVWPAPTCQLRLWELRPALIKPASGARQPDCLTCRVCERTLPDRSPESSVGLPRQVSP